MEIFQDAYCLENSFVLSYSSKDLDDSERLSQIVCKYHMHNAQAVLFLFGAKVSPNENHSQIHNVGLDYLMKLSNKFR